MQTHWIPWVTGNIAESQRNRLRLAPAPAMLFKEVSEIVFKASCEGRWANMSQVIPGDPGGAADLVRR